MDREIQNKAYWDDLIIDHLSQNISKDDADRLKAWIGESDEHKRYLDKMRDLWDSSVVAAQGFPFDPDQAYLLFKRKIREQAIPFSRQSKKRTLLWKAVAVAAALVPFLFLSHYTYLYFEGEQTRSGLQLSEIVSPKGSKTQLRLADGTEVCLNSGSSIQYGEGFGTKNRNLILSGEAYLKVQRNEQLPFIVSAGEIDIKVLGTEFNVDAYPESEEIRVSLIKGAVSMSDRKNHNSIVLKPMETGVFRHNSRKLTLVSDDMRQALDWMQDRLVFKGETFENIVRQLERRFDVEIRVQDKKLLEKRFGGDFKPEESLDQILKIMSSSGKFKYKKKGRIVEIY
ncbi:MAG: DUF4974 domain-containing protein [Parabacteroides sp.]|nr:DUF4974 domain-containing protein [Parabacteroides sp.]